MPCEDAAAPEVAPAEPHRILALATLHMRTVTVIERLSNAGTMALRAPVSEPAVIPVQNFHNFPLLDRISQLLFITEVYNIIYSEIYSNTDA